jgi:MoxR-like ATPase
MTANPLYFGDGKQRPEAARTLPDVDPEALRRPEHYRAGADLQAAVTTALTLGMPLLLTGEPGSGKSRLAHSIAWELDLPLTEFVVKSDTQARDLLYRFDTVGRFHASQTEGKAADPRRFITFEALGRAILHAKPSDYAHGKEEGQLRLPAAAVEHPGRPTRSVVLIDEIDKAPRDVPNDLLVEIERLRFAIPELASDTEPLPLVELTRAERAYRPIVVITSNSEKALPEPFLRRCVYHHLELPPFDADLPSAERAARVTIEDIVKARLGARFAGGGDRLFDDLLSFYRYLRRDAQGLAHRPSLAELLNWLDALVPEGRRGPPAGGVADLDPDELLAKTRNLLFKNQPDQAQTRALIERWRETRAASPGAQGR